MPSIVSATNLIEQAGVAVITGSEYQGLGVRNLLTEALSEVWRFSGSATVQIGLPAASVADVLALAAPRDGMQPAAGATIRVAASDGLSVVYDSGAVPLVLQSGYYVLALPAVPARAWSVAINAPAGQPYMQFSRLWIGPAVATVAFLGEDQFAPSLADSDLFAPRRTTQVTLSLSQAQADALEDMAMAIGTQRQCLLVPRMERGGRGAVFGKMTALPAPKPIRNFNALGQMYTASLTVQEGR